MVKKTEYLSWLSLNLLLVVQNRRKHIVSYEYSKRQHNYESVIVHIGLFSFSD